MLYSDLHIHSSYSDGRLSPEQIINLSIERGIKCISITDHDTIGAQYIIKDFNYKEEIDIISGIEISCQYKNMEIHILGYFLNIENIELKACLEKIKYSRQERVNQIINKLRNLNLDIKIEDISEEDYNRSVGRLHIAKLLVEKGYANNTKEAFYKYLMKDRSAYVERCKISYKDALRLIISSNGIPVMAHPGQTYSHMVLENIIKDLKVYGLKGIEVFHPSHSSKQSNTYYNLAKKYSLVITGGSDCHGNIINGNYTLGTVGISEKLTNKLLKLKY